MSRRMIKRLNISLAQIHAFPHNRNVPQIFRNRYIPNQFSKLKKCPIYCQNDLCTKYVSWIQKILLDVVYCSKFFISSLPRTRMSRKAAEDLHQPDNFVYGHSHDSLPHIHISKFNTAHYIMSVSKTYFENKIFSNLSL